VTQSYSKASIHGAIIIGTEEFRMLLVYVLLSILLSVDPSPQLPNKDIKANCSAVALRVVRL
jgi:hypothetical protein